MDAAKILSHFLNHQGYDTNAKIVTVSHSHGGNLLNIVSRSMKTEHPIKLMIHFACPRRAAYEYQPVNYKKLIYLFSDGDWVTIAGRPQERSALQSLGYNIVIGVAIAATAVAAIGLIAYELNKESKEESDTTINNPL